jgi:hypothetical protein
MPLKHLEHHAPAGLQLLGRKPGDQHLGELLGSEILQVGSELVAKLVAEASIGDRELDGVLACSLVLQRVLQQLRDVQDLDPVLAKLLAEQVVFLPGFAHPGL